MSLNDILNSNKPQGLELKIDKIVAEIGNVVPQGKTLDVGGQTYTIDELVKKLLEVKAFFSAPRETRAALRQMVADRKRMTPEVTGLLSDVHAGLVGVLGRTSPELEKLGFRPRRKPVLSLEEKLRRSAKGQLTRKERNTLVPRQKESIQGGEPLIVVAPGHTTVTPATEKGPTA